MPEQKRKRESTIDRPSKKVAIASSTRADTVKVTILDTPDSWAPILASTPGLSLPALTSFKPYTKPRPQTPRSAPTPEILLHSPANAKLDYVAREEDAAEAGGLLKHYIGVYNPERGDLQLVPARKVTVRGTLRSAAAPSTAKEEDGSQNTLSARSTLGLTFGTKKSRKAILALTENAISPSKASSKSSSQHKSTKLDPLASAVVDSMASTTADMPTREEMQAEINSSKPIPPPNLEAQSAEEVWTLESLVGLQTLRGVQVKEWMETVQQGGEIKCKSRFVANRIEKLVASNDVKSLRGLRYLLLLIEWYHSLKKGAKGVLRVPRKEETLQGWPSELVDGVGLRFAEGGQLNTWHTHNLLTHILALALVLDGCVSDTKDVRDDLRLDNKEISTLSTELSTPLTPPTDHELKRLRMTKTEALSSGHRFARLKLPLAFPRMRVMGNRGGRR